MKEYLNYSKASKISDSKARIIYRLLEILPGAFSWTTLLAAVFFSWYKPVWAACFIIVFALYWLFRTFYFSVHLYSAFKRMKAYRKTNWFKKVKEVSREGRKKDSAPRNWEEIYQLVVFPMYKEPFEIVEQTFEALCNSAWPNKKMIVVLATEEKGGEETQETAEKIKKKFGNEFFKFLVTTHPADLPGEVTGKGANETWAAKKAKKLVDKLEIPYQNIIFSPLDVDTVVPPQYFSCVAYHFLTVEKPTRTSYQPIPLFTNNIWDAPSFSRVFSFSSTFWHTMNQERPEKLITFSSHSMCFKSLVEVGFKQPDVVSDDSRIFWQCFLKYDGDYYTQPIFYPVCMDANVAPTFFRTARNVYKQQRRWAYGVGDIPYFLYGFLKNKEISLLRKIRLSVELLEGHWSWATSSIVIFLLGWLPLFLGGPDFNQSLLSYNLPRLTSKILTLAMVGLMSSAFLSIILIPPKPPRFGKHKYVLLLLEWVMLPVLMIFFTALPALDAQTRWMLGKYMGFWATPKQRENKK